MEDLFQMPELLHEQTAKEQNIFKIINLYILYKHNKTILCIYLIFQHTSLHSYKMSLLFVRFDFI